MSTRWDERARCWCGDPRVPGELWCANCLPAAREDERSQARERAKHMESKQRRERS